MPLLDEREKLRLQQIFEWSNRGSVEDERKHFNGGEGEGSDEEVTITRKPTRGSIEELRVLLDGMAKEVEEREAFMDRMQRLGKAQLYREQIRSEIQERVKQMKEIQNNIARQERKNLERKLEAAQLDPSNCCPSTFNAACEKTPALASYHDLTPKSKSLLEHELTAEDCVRVERKKTHCGKERAHSSSHEARSSVRKDRSAKSPTRKSHHSRRSSQPDGFT